MSEINKLTVKATGPFELRDPQQDMDIGEKPVEVLETSFISQMISLKRLKVVEGKTTQDAEIEKSNHNPSIGESLPTRDAEPTIAELNETRVPQRGRPRK